MTRLKMLAKELVRNLLGRKLSVYWIARAPDVFRCLELEQGDVVLEIGCGSGNWTAAFVDVEAKVVAFDIDSNQARAARESTGGEAHVLVATAEALPFAEGTFDKLTLIDVIEHVGDDVRAFKESARVLRGGGRQVVTTLRVDRTAIFHRVEFADHLREYTWKALYALSNDAQLQVVNTFEFYRTFATLAWEGQHLVVSWSWIRHVPGLSTLLWLFLSLIARLDGISKARGRGLGILVRKPEGIHA